jgi:hypothetical protein
MITLREKSNTQNEETAKIEGMGPGPAVTCSMVWWDLDVFFKKKKPNCQSKKSGGVVLLLFFLFSCRSFLLDEEEGKVNSIQNNFIILL